MNTAAIIAAAIAWIAWSDGENLVVEESRLTLFDPAFFVDFSDQSGKRFLTLTNRTYLDFAGSYVVRVSEVEWAIITNKYSENIKTNDVHFYSTK